VLTVVVYGNAATQGSAKAVISKSTGRPMLKKDNERSQNDWRANVRAATVSVMGGRDPMEGPVVLAVTFTRLKPLSAPKRRPHWPFTKPDLDKLVRAVGDGLKDGGAYADDARVVRVMALKGYPVTGDDYVPPDPDKPADYMLSLWPCFGPGDLLNTPGAVIRLAHLTEFEDIRKQLAEVGCGPEHIPGGNWCQG
jgi:Holliday junction resolvase RusA-like endonuclease